MNKKKKSKEVEEFAASGVVREDPPLRHQPSAIRHLLDFEEMQVWQDAQDLAASVYEDMWKIRDFSYVDQLKRAAVSISNNIAEGAERTTSGDFARFLDIAKGSAGEVRSMYRLAIRLKFVRAETADARCELCKSISRQLGGFAKHLRARRNSE